NVQAERSIRKAVHLPVDRECVIETNPRHQTRAPLLVLHEVHRTCRFEGSSLPPALFGWMWPISRPRYRWRPFLRGTGSPGRQPQERQRLPARRRIVARTPRGAGGTLLSICAVRSTVAHARSRSESHSPIASSAATTRRGCAPMRSHSKNVGRYASWVSWSTSSQPLTTRAAIA